MYCIYVFGRGYVAKYKNGDFSYSDYSPDVIDRDLAYEIAEGINKRSGLEVVIKELTEEDDYIFNATKLTLKDLKKGNAFQFKTNTNDVFVVISDKEFIGVSFLEHSPPNNRVGMFFNTITHQHDEVKRIML